LAIQDPSHFELPVEYTIIKQELDLVKAGLVKFVPKPFDEANLEEMFMIKIYNNALYKVQELKKKCRKKSPLKS